MAEQSPLMAGLAHHQAGRLREAEAAYRLVLAREPNNPDALHLLGVIATAVKQFEPAVQLITQAIRIRGDVAFYHNNLGNALRSLRRRREAYESYGRALALQPDYVEARINRASTLREQAMFADAVAEYEIAAKTHPQLACAPLATALNDQGRVEESIAAYRRAVELDPANVEAHSNLLYELHFSDHISPGEIYAEHLTWAKEHAEELTRNALPHANDRSPDRMLRIGYVSGDFRDHPVARFLWPLIEYRDRSRFHVTCFSNVESPDGVTSQYRRAADAWFDVAPQNDADLALFIRAQKIDILVDLGGHTSGGRMMTFARKPAPVQVTYLGYPDTTGMTAMDVRITDDRADPPEADARHVERLERVNGCFLCYAIADQAPPVSPLPALANGYITFGSFNNLAKITRTTIEMWKSVLAAVPKSRMLIKTTSLGDEPTRERAATRFAQWGLPMDRVSLAGPTESQAEHLAAYAHVDIALDTFPYNGTTTTCEALSMGVPVVSAAGDHHAARVGLSLLTAAGHPEWTTEVLKLFPAIAARLARDLKELSAVRLRLRADLKTSILCDALSFTRKHEAIYRSAWARWCRE